MKWLVLGVVLVIACVCNGDPVAVQSIKPIERLRHQRLQQPVTSPVKPFVKPVDAVNKPVEEPILDNSFQQQQMLGEEATEGEATEGEATEGDKALDVDGQELPIKDQLVTERVPITHEAQLLGEASEDTEGRRWGRGGGWGRGWGGRWGGFGGWGRFGGLGGFGGWGSPYLGGYGGWGGYFPGAFIIV